MTEQAISVRAVLKNVDTGKAPARMFVGAVRACTLYSLPADAKPVPIEIRGVSEVDGTVNLQVPPGTPGLEEVIVLPLSPLYQVRTHSGWKPWHELTAAEALADAPRCNVLAGDICQVDVRTDWPEPRTEMVPMRDGAKLATEIFLPPGDGPWPAVLVRTPYGRFMFHDHAAALLPEGYAVVVQDMRGRFDSEGVCIVFADCGWGERQDGYDTVEWIASQPWCNGKVATVGGSAMGITQYLLAGAAPPHLCCQVIIVGVPSLYHFAGYPGGMFRKEQVEQWLALNEFPPENLELICQHYCYDEWWQQFDATRDEIVQRVNVPALHIGGFYDTFNDGTIEGFKSRQERGGEGARGRQWLIMGPWPHAIGTRQVGEVTWPENAAFDLWAEARLFLAHFLKGEDNGYDRQPPVRYYMMGPPDEHSEVGLQWRAADKWPPETAEEALYLTAHGQLATAPGAAGTVTWRHDPFDPVPSIGGFNLVIPPGPMDQRPAEQRSDVAVFTSAPLEQPIEIAGQPKAVLWVSSNCLDTDIVVKLCDVYPDGRSMLVTYGGLRLRFREGFEREKLLELGEVYRVEIPLANTAYAFAACHRIRISVQSADFPHFDVNPGSGEPIHQHTFSLPALNTLHIGPEMPCHILLPVLSGSLAEALGGHSRGGRPCG